MPTTTERHHSPRPDRGYEIDEIILRGSALHSYELSAGLGFTDDIPTGGERRHWVASTPPSSVETTAETSPKDGVGLLSDKHSWYHLYKDWTSILFLLILYTVQGVPMGLSASIPFMLQGNVSYKQQALFSLASLPFSFKVFWAPFVDSVYWPSIGRRKTWLIPVQLLCSFLMYYGSHSVDNWMTLDKSRQHPNVEALVFYFGFLYFLMATQDVAVDGWSLTMLSYENRAFSSACNAIGQTLGFSIAHVGFLALQDPQTCNKWFRSIPSVDPLVTLGSFLRFWGVVIFLTTLFAICFKEENDDEIENDLSVKETYKILLEMFKIPSIKELILILLTCRLAFGPIDAATHLKLVDAGLTKEQLAFFGPLLLPIGIVCPLLIGKWTNGPRPLRWFVRGWRFRFVVSFFWLALIPLTRWATSSVTTPFWLLCLVFLISLIHSVATDVMFSSQMAFFAHIADPAVGGTYMTLLNTITNIGNRWPSTLSLCTLDFISKRSSIDGFIIQTICFSCLGLLWFLIFYRRILRLESFSKHDWLVVRSKLE